MVKNNSGHIDLKAIDNKLSQDFVNSSKRTKNPYSQFLKDLFSSDFFNNSPYEFKDVIKVEKVKIYNVVRVKKEYSDEFKTLKNKKQRELHLKALLKNVEIEIVDVDGVTQTPPPTLNTLTNAYINELQGAFNNTDREIAKNNEILEEYINVADVLKKSNKYLPKSNFAYNDS
jgi:phenylalanyl-tRNA synthetase alpha subunit